MSVISQSATQLKQLLQKREISSVELVRAYLDQIEQHDTSIGSFLSIRPEQALQHAQQRVAMLLSLVTLAAMFFLGNPNFLEWLAGFGLWEWAEPSRRPGQR